MNLEQAFTERRDADDWINHLYEKFQQQSSKEGIEVVNLDELREKNWTQMPIDGPEHSDIPFAEFRANPDTAPLGTPSGRIEIFSETIEGFKYDDCAGHAMWHAPDEWLGSESEKNHPLHLVSPQPGDKLHSQLESALADEPGARPATVTMNTKDATSRRIAGGDLVRVFNDRGSCLARAVLADNVRPGVIAIPTGAWLDLDQDGIDVQGNPNVLTRDIGTSKLGQGSSAHTTLVQVESWMDR